MASKKLYFNGIDGRTGKYLLPPMTSREVSAIGLSATTLSRPAAGDSSREPIFDCDPRNLAETGWGVIYAPGTPGQIKKALSRLLEHRREQAGEHDPSYFQEYEYQSGETASQFLRRNGAKAGTADADRVPYYLLIVGGPEKIPFHFQSDLDVNYAVGRLHFDNVGEYEVYASSVVDAETGQRRPRLSRQVTFFGVRNEGDLPTRQTADELVGAPDPDAGGDWKKRLGHPHVSGAASRQGAALPAPRGARNARAALHGQPWAPIPPGRRAPA